MVNYCKDVNAVCRVAYTTYDQ